MIGNSQYQDSRKLASRAALHRLFSTNPVSWNSWVQSKLNISSCSQILEVGCGPGYLWESAFIQYPEKISITLSDLSIGMVKEARSSLQRNNTFSFTAADTLKLPFQDTCFDLVIANHMLYHARSVLQALDEIYRVLVPSGCLCTATNGSDHLIEIKRWAEEYLPHRKRGWATSTAGFNLENGGDLLASQFDSVTLHSYPDQLIVTEVQPLIDYTLSFLDDPAEPDLLADLETFLSRKLERDGSLRITKDTGMFTAIKT